MKNKLILPVIVALVVIAVVGFLVTSLAPKEKNEVTVSDRGLASVLPLYVAIEKGYLEQEEITPKLVKLTAGNDVFNALLSGDLDVGELPIDPIMFNEAKSPTGVKIFLVGRWSEESNKNFDILLVNKNSTIKSLNDLEGKKVGVFPGVTSQTFLRYYLRNNEVDVKGIEFVPLAPPVQLQALSTGQIDALWAYQPTATVGLNTGLKKLDEGIFNKLGFTYYAVYAFSKDFVEKKPDVAKRIQRAMAKATEFMAQNHEESRKILGNYTALGDLATQMSYFPEYEPPFSLDIEGLRYLSEFYKDQNITQSSIEPTSIIFQANQ